jgi:multisubunit Na+/H+ antiporter MnhE subunit
MKLTNPFASFLPYEYILLIIFIIYLVFDIETPHFLNGIVDSPVGMTVIFGITVSLFLYSNPIVAILYLFVAYELLRRSSNTTVIKRPYFRKNIENTPTLNSIDLSNRNLNKNSITVSNDTTLEEEVVDKMGPIGKSDPVSYVETGFKPFADTIQGASRV